MTYSEHKSGMTRHTALKMKNKYVLFFLSAVLALIGFVSWRDMQPKPVQSTARAFITDYFVANPAALTALPDDSHMAVIDIGAIHVASETGALTFTGNGVAPTVLAGRESNLFINLDIPPARLLDALDVIDQQIQAWRAKNIVMTVVFFKITPDIITAPQLPEFVEKLVHRYKANYLVGFSTDPVELKNTPALRTALANTQRYVRDFLFFADETQPLKDTLLALEDLRLPYALVLNQLPQNLQVQDIGDIKFLSRFLIKR